MSKFEKLLQRIKNLDKDLRFEELRKVLESYGYTMSNPNGGSSHYTFRKKGATPVTVPKHVPVKIIYIRMIKDIIEGERDE